MELEAAAPLGCIVKANLSNPDGRVVTSCTAGGAAAVLAFATPATPRATQTVQGGATEQLHPLALGAPHVYGASGDLLHRALSLLDSDFGCGNLLAAPLLL